MDALTAAIIEYRYYIEVLAIVIAVLTAISSVDDVFVDLYYWGMRLLGQDAKDKEFARLVRDAASLPERPFAIMIPTWKEQDVIFSMVATNSRLLAYKNYHYFIGVYRNDQGTMDEVREVQLEHANVHMVVVPRDGPTSKADCLNIVLAEIQSYEVKAGMTFAGIALHDAEDFIHPHELQVFNWAVGIYDFVQLPVFSFNQPYRDFVGGIYMDEFAEVHTKDLSVRRHISGLVPCAGVSACFSHEAIARLASSNQGEVFRTSCFTEDYDIAFRLRALGLKSTFLSCPVNYTIDMKKNPAGANDGEDEKTAPLPIFVQRNMPIATREFFPSDIRGAYRQRARWLIGIVFQGTSTHGWQGDWGTRYFLARDRKGILTGPVVMLGYFVLVNLVLIALYLSWFANGQSFYYSLLSLDVVFWLFFVNLIFLLWRLCHRMIFTTKIYHLGHGILAAPRLIIANFVNFFAVVRAVRLYVGHLITGAPLVWDKTSHSYPFQFRQTEAPGDWPVPARVRGKSTGSVVSTTLLMLAVWSGLFVAGISEARAQSKSVTAPAVAVSARTDADKTEAEIRAAQAAVAADPASEWAVRALVDALSRAGRKQEALAEADRFASVATVSVALRAQRGFLRRELGDIRGGIEDFSAALAGDELASDQRRNVEAGLAEARSQLEQAEIGAAQAALAKEDFRRAAEAAQVILARTPGSEVAMRIRVDALSRSGDKREALAVFDRFVALGTASLVLRAQRGFLRRELQDVAGAIEDFTAALAGDELSGEERRNVEAGLLEARVALSQSRLDLAQTALTRRDFTASADMASAVLQRDPNSDAAMAIRFNALLGAGRKREAMLAANRLIASGHRRGWVYASRGYLRSDTGDLAGAVKDFDVAIASHDMDARALRTVRTARAEAAARLAVKKGNPRGAEAAYRDALAADPGWADGWFKLGYLLQQQGQPVLGSQALQRGLEVRRVGKVYVDAAGPYVLENAPLASQLAREGLDRWYAGDASLTGLKATDIERFRNEVVEADASIRTTLAYGTIVGRPESAGGRNNIYAAETTVRFDGRYLPAVPRLEAFVRGLSGKDAIGETETDAGIGVRYRPIPGLNFYVGGLVDHFFTQTPRTELVVNWGLGVGADAYPYETGWKSYWDFGTFGAWRTADKRLLEDTRGNIGFMYQFRAPFRGAIGPTVLAVASYDNQATIPWAGGIGPSILSTMWLGGDKYRSYDQKLFLQVGYLINVGADQRQKGWRGLVGITF